MADRARAEYSGEMVSRARYALRALSQRPAHTATAVLAFALGIGLTTTMFSIVNGALLRGLPFEDANRLMHIEQRLPREGQLSLDVPADDFLLWRERQHSFDGLAAFYSEPIVVRGTNDYPERYVGAKVTANLFDVLRVRPVVGRGLQDGDDQRGAEPVVVISDAMWTNRFGRNPAIVGSTLRANGQSRTVVGVMPEGFRFPLTEDVWLPLVLDGARSEAKRSGGYEIVGRLKSSVSREQARVELATLSERLRQERLGAERGVDVGVTPYVQAFLGRELIQVLYTMLAAVAGVLIVACANVANLLLAGMSVRVREVALRSALGATRLDVLMQFLIETLLIAACGAVLGIVLTSAALSLFNWATSSTNPPFWVDIRLDGTALLFTIALTVVSALASGLLPAWRASKANIAGVLRSEGRTASSITLGRLSRALVTIEIAASCGLLVVAALMVKSVVSLQRADRGFPTGEVTIGRLGPLNDEYLDAARRNAFFNELQRKLSESPLASAVTIGSVLPSMSSPRTVVSVREATSDGQASSLQAHVILIAPGYFRTFSVGVTSGRDFTERDGPESVPVAVVNQSFVRKYLGGGDPLARHVRVGGGDDGEPWREIVGVVPDLDIEPRTNENLEAVYTPLSQGATRLASVAVRSRGPASEVVRTLRREVAALDAELAVHNIGSMTQMIADSTWFFGVFGGLFIVFGGAALLLAVIGLYGVIAFFVSQRTREFGVRLSVGAQRRHVLTHVLGQGSVQIGLGIVCGLLLASWLARAASALLFRVQPWDPTVFAGVAAILLVAALVACLVPARRAMNVNPVAALRQE